MPQPKDQPVDELREQITHLVHGDWISYESLQSGRVGGVNDNTEPETTELVDKLYELCQAECNRARKEAVDYFYWRIDCNTLISELEGWRGCIDTAKDQTERHFEQLMKEGE